MERRRFRPNWTTWLLGLGAAGLCWQGFDLPGFGIGFAAAMLLWWADKDWIRRAGQAAMARQAALSERPLAERPLPMLLYEWAHAHEDARDRDEHAAGSDEPAPDASAHPDLAALDAELNRRGLSIRTAPATDPARGPDRQP